MRITKSVVFGLMGLLCTVNATKATGKPVLAKRQTVVTVTNDGCTAVCVDLSSVNLGGGTECDVFCDGAFTQSLLATSTPVSTPCVISSIAMLSIKTLTATSTVTTTTTTKAALIPRTVTSFDFDDITRLHCDFDKYGTVCIADGSPGGPFTTTVEPALNPRTLVSATEGDCKALCWDLKPGSTECDVQCSSDFKTKASAPSKAAHVANLEARENVQAHEVREARLARKFGGHVARDETTTVTVTDTTVTVDIYPESWTAGPESFISTTIAGSPTILPMQVPQKAGASNISAALSHAASAALSFAQATTSAASPALSQASASLSAMAAAAPISVNATVVTTPSTASAFTTATVTRLSTVLATTTATSTSSGTITTSATITPIAPFPGVSEAGTIASGFASSASGFASSIAVTFTGAASEYTVSTGLVLSLLVGLAASVAFLI